MVRSRTATSRDLRSMTGSLPKPRDDTPCGSKLRRLSRDASFLAAIPGLDFKATGGFVVAPPSVHASGRRYEWSPGRSPSEIPLAALPEWLGDAARRPSPGARMPRGSGAVGEGQRNAHLASFAGAARRQGLDGKALVAAVLEENERRCEPLARA